MPGATQEEKEHFVLNAIKALRDTSRSQGIHVRISGFNDAFRQKFGEDPRAFTEKMAAEGKIVVQPRKGGAMMYLPGEAPAGALYDGKSALERIDSFKG